MSISVSDRIRSRIARSLPLVQQRRDLLVERMERSLSATPSRDAAPGQGDAAATVLAALLLGQARRLVESGAFGPLDDIAAEHRALGIAGRHYSRFGDALMPVLRDLLGPTSPREVAAAWCDTFWAIVHAARASEPAVLAAAPA